MASVEADLQVGMPISTFDLKECIAAKLIWLLNTEMLIYLYVAQVEMSRKVKLVADKLISNLNGQQFDLIALPGQALFSQ